MQQLLRLWPYLQPHRRLVVLAVAAAGLASALWAGVMLLAFPISKVLLEQKTLNEFVANELATARAAAEKCSRKLQDFNHQHAHWPEAARANNADYAQLLHDRARCQTQLADAHRREWWATFWQQRVLPWLPVDRFDSLACLFGGLLLITALHGAAVYAQELWIGHIVQAAMRTLRARLFRCTLRLDAQTLGVEGVPALMSRFTNDLNGISLGITLLGGKILLEPLKAGACIFAAFTINWRLTLLSLLCAPLGAVLFRQLGKRLKRASHHQMETVARLYRVLQEALDSFRVMTAFGNQRRHRRELYFENREYFHKAMQINRIDALINPAVETLGITAACLAVLPAAFLVVQHKTTVLGIQLSATPMELADLAVLYTLLAGVIDPARKLSSCFSRLKKALAACDRVYAWMDREPLVRDVAATKPGFSESRASETRGEARLSEKPGFIDALPHHQSLEFDRVSFRYSSVSAGVERPDALEDVSLRIEFGEVVAIVGGNGSGKSTLVGLLPRFYDPRHGAVRIDGIDIRDVSVRELRSRIGWVPQEPMLFDGNIVENIAHGDRGASRADVEDVARRAHVAQFAADWPQGLDTPIGEKGSRLSGGQRQRVALARAMLRNPALLVLDEATSAIDAQSELLIHQTLREFSRDRTTLIVTHALTAQLLEFVTRIVVLDQGRLVAVGRHEALLATCPAYASLFAAQLARRAA